MTKEKPTPEQCRRLRLLCYFSGVSDIVIGAAIAFLAPEYLGNDPTESHIIGALVALLSLPTFWVGYRYIRARKDETGSDPVFKVKD